MDRITKMLRTEDVAKDLGITKNTVFDLMAIGILNPIKLGKGWKFSQEEILEFQRNYRGYDVSNRESAMKAHNEIKKSHLL